MKKVFRKLMLVVVVLLSCTMLVACTKDISQSDYTTKVSNAAKVYYKTRSDSSMTINSSSKENSSWTQHVYFGTDDENSLSADFSRRVESTQKIEIYQNTTGQKYTNIRVTETQKVTTTGKEENDSETGLVAFTSVEEYVTVTTIVTTYTDGVASVKAYVSEKSTIDGVAEPEEKYVYTYLNAEYGAYDVETILEDINQDILEDGFFSTSYVMFNLYGGKIECYTNDDVNFGYNASMNLSVVNNKQIEDISMSAECVFENNLPKKIVSNMNQAITNDHVAEVGDDANLSTSMSNVVSFEYSCGTITTPAGYEQAETTYQKPVIDVMDIEISMGL